MRSLDPCPACSSGTMLTYCTRRRSGGAQVVRFLKCDVCGATAKELAESRTRNRVPDLVRSRIEKDATRETMKAHV